MNVMRWLLDSDPSIRWQALRDFTDESDEGVAAERSRVASEGWGAALLAFQAPDGHFVVRGKRGWSTDLHALVLLKDMGLDPASAQARSAVERVREHLIWEFCDDHPFFDGETEPCINGAVVALGAYFGEGRAALVDRLLEEQLEDGGWNCQAPPNTRSSFPSTIRVLEGLLQYEKSYGAAAAITESRLRGHAYLLERRMLRSLRSGDVIDRRWMRFAFPPTWHYDVLRGLDYLRSADVEPGDRIVEAVEIVEKRRHQNGLWPLDVLHTDRIPFDMDAASRGRAIGIRCAPVACSIGHRPMCGSLQVRKPKPRRRGEFVARNTARSVNRRHSKGHRPDTHCASAVPMT